MDAWSLLCTCNRVICRPIALYAVPDLKSPVKSHTDGVGTAGISDDVVAAQGVSCIDGLDQWKVCVGSGMNLDRWGARHGQDLFLSHCQGEDVDRVRWTSVSLYQLSLRSCQPTIVG